MDVSNYMVNSLHFYVFSVTWIESFLPAFSLCALHLTLCIETVTLPFCLYLLTKFRPRLLPHVTCPSSPPPTLASVGAESELEVTKPR